MARFFTLAEANAMLPQLKRMLPEMQGTATRLKNVQAELQELRERVRLNGEAQHAEELARQQSHLESELRGALARLQELGVELKDLSSGLVDFRHRRDGRTVYLCWLLGEDSVTHWHELNTGFSGRQPL